MEKPQPKLFSTKAQSVLGQFDTITEKQQFIAEGGPLEKEIRSFLVSVAGLLKSDCSIQDWRQDFSPNDDESDDEYISVKLFPKAWELPETGPVAFSISWMNPFLEDAEDLAVELQIPWNWEHAKELLDLVASHLPEGFTNVYDGDADASIPYWRNLRFQDFIEESRFNVQGFYQEICSAFRSLLSLRPVIDEYLSHCGATSEGRTARRKLGVVAVVDTETAGTQQELIEIAVVNAAYDRETGEVFGILEECEELREPKSPISNADQRFNGLGMEQVRGRTLNEERIKSLLKRADFVVAHNASFDKSKLVDQFKWAAELDWRDSLNRVAWETETRDLPSLLKHHGVDCEISHRAGPDARALLELLSYSGGGNCRPYLAQLLLRPADAAEA